MKLGLIAFAVLIGTAFCWQPSTNYEYKAELGNEDRLWLYWDIDLTAKEITFEVHATTQGYWGIGFSWNGAMPYADIVVGWIDSQGKPHLNDRHVGASPGKPIRDSQQDYVLIGGQNDGTYFRMAFKRKLDTCDTKDFVIGHDTMRALWTINDHKPQGPDDIVRHQPQHRGNRAIYFFDMHTAGAPPTGPDIHTFDVLAHKAPLPQNYHSLFWCHVIQKPDTGRVQMIRYEPLIEKGHEPYVHHMVLFQCTGQDMSKWVNKEEPCWDPTDNPEKFSAMGVCTQYFLAAWAVGDNAHIYPKDVGYPLFESGGPTYYMLQTHYDNSAYKKNITDSSGLRIYYTTKPRKYEAALFSTGTFTMEATPTVPSHMPSFTNYGLCPASCTQNLPKKGIKVFSGFLHMHLIGRVQKVRLFRNGIEQKPLFEDNNWDFAYQQVRMLNSPRTILPGDEIQTECGMSSVGRNWVTLGGEATRNEMCFAFMEYWPKPKDSVQFCFSSYNYTDAIINFLGAKAMKFSKSPINPGVTIQTKDGQWVKYQDWVNNVIPWTEYDPENGKMLQDNFQTYIKNNGQFGVCGLLNQERPRPQMSLTHATLKSHMNDLSIGIKPVIEVAKMDFFIRQGIFNGYTPYSPPQRCMAPNIKSSTNAPNMKTTTMGAQGFKPTLVTISLALLFLFLNTK